MNNNIEITSADHISCASLTINCLADSGICDWQTAFAQHIANAEKLGLMPDDFKVIRETLQNFGFVMQSTSIENKKAGDVFSSLGTPHPQSIVFLHISDYFHLGGYMLAFRANDGRFVPVSPLPCPDYLERQTAAHIWIRWNDGVDRSPCPRKKAKCGTKAPASGRTYEETACYKPYQPNPSGRSIGDCVIRAAAGALDITWNEALRLLASNGNATVNSREVYPQVLKKNGFVHHRALTVDGRRLDGKAFCNQLNQTCSNGERIFARVGRSHAAAIVPVPDGSGKVSYKIIDSWDSSKRLIGEYWVFLPKKTAVCEPVRFRTGDRLRHPSFGEGIVAAVSKGVLTIDFGNKGSRRLGEEWVLGHCIFTEDRQ